MEFIPAAIIFGCCVIGMCLNNLGNKVAEHASAIRDQTQSLRKILRDIHQDSKPKAATGPNRGYLTTNIALQEYTNSAGSEAQGGAR